MKRFLPMLLVAASILAACGADADPSTVIEEYEEAYNSGDIDAVMALFTEDSALINHPYAPYSTGLAAIRAVQVDDIAAAAAENAYTFSNIEVSGNNVRWDQQWTGRDGGAFCRRGQSAVVEGGMIVSWTWSSTGTECP